MLGMLVNAAWEPRAEPLVLPTELDPRLSLSCWCSLVSTKHRSTRLTLLWSCEYGALWKMKHKKKCRS